MVHWEALIFLHINIAQHHHTNNNPYTFQPYPKSTQETKSALAFMTEPIVCSGADMLCEFASIPGGARVHADFFGQGGSNTGGAVSEMEISRGVCQLVEGLQVRMFYVIYFLCI